MLKLIEQVKVTARLIGANEYAYDGPTANNAPWQMCTENNCVSMFPWWISKSSWDTSPPTVPYSDVADFFRKVQGAQALSQYNGGAVWFRLGDWYGRWYAAGHYLEGEGWVGRFHGQWKVNSYGLGTLLHEILHKQSVGGGFTHKQIAEAAGGQEKTPEQLALSPLNPYSQWYGDACFVNAP